MGFQIRKAARVPSAVVSEFFLFSTWEQIKEAGGCIVRANPRSHWRDGKDAALDQSHVKQLIEMGMFEPFIEG